MLKIGLHVIDTKNYVKSLVTSHNAAILERVRETPIYFSQPSAILEKVRDVPISLIHYSMHDFDIDLLNRPRSNVNMPMESYVMLSYVYEGK